MKKQIIAAAVAAAFAVPAMAQVTVYGRLDAGYTSVNSDAAGKFAGVSYSSMTSSRIGFEGSEDLGGGLKASFRLEEGIGSAATTGTTAAGAAAADGAAASTITINDFGRAAWVGLAGGFGSLRVGLQDTATKGVFDTHNAGGANNVAGRLGDTLVLPNNQFGSRYTAARYDAPAMGGINVSLALMRNSDRNAAGADNTTNTGQEIAASYRAGALSINGAIYRVQVANDINTDQTSVGLTYDLGMAKVHGLYGSIEIEGNDEKDTGYEIGVSVPFGNTSIFASMAKATDQASEDRTGYQFGARYTLSKRTYAYGLLGNAKADANANADTEQYAFGVVHQF